MQNNTITKAFIELKKYIDQEIKALRDLIISREVDWEVKSVKNILSQRAEIIEELKGEDGHTPTEDELLALIKPLIPEVEHGKTPTKEELLALIRPLIPQVESGKTPTREEILELIEPLIPEMSTQEVAMEACKMAEEAIMPKIPTLEQMENDLPRMGEKFRDGLELLEGDERLDIKAIKGIDEEINKLRSDITRIGSSRGGSRKTSIVKRIRLTDQCNGVTKTFVLPKDTVDVLGVFGSQFPLNYDPYNSSGGDWSLSGNTLVLGDSVSAPEAGQTLWCLVETLFY